MDSDNCTKDAKLEFDPRHAQNITKINIFKRPLEIIDNFPQRLLIFG